MPDCTTVCAQTRPKDADLALSSAVAELQEPGEIQTIGATGFYQVDVNQHCANRTNYSFR